METQDYGVQDSLLRKRGTHSFDFGGLRWGVSGAGNRSASIEKLRSTERPFSEAVAELVEVVLEGLRADAVEGAAEPGLEVAEGGVRPRTV